MPSHEPGLSREEAERLLAAHGRNQLRSSHRIEPLFLFLNQFKNVLMLLLFIASIISFLIGDKPDTFFILTIILLNAVLGFIQEYKAENALASLKDMTISKIRVVRDGIEQMIDSHLLVPGDIMKLEEGDKIPADGEVRSARHLEVNEASLTGESLPVAKSEEEQKNTVYMGTIVTGGSAVIRVTATGQNTKFGQMAASLTTIQEEKTPLERKIAVLGRQLTFLAVAITVIIFLLGILQNRPFVQMVLTSISLAVAAVPEGLPAVITIALAVGLQRMAKKRAILRRLSAIEALGNTTVIVTDKTGTLTENKMRVIKVWSNGVTHRPQSLTDSIHDSDTDELLRIGVLCNNATLVHKEHARSNDIIGEQTEGSLLLLAHETGINMHKIKSAARLTDEFAFDQQRKLMSMVYEENGITSLYTKGAPESVLEHSSFIQRHGKNIPLTNDVRKNVQDTFNEFARNGLRILALAKRDIPGNIRNREEAEQDLVFVGFVGIADPPREEVKNVIKMAHQAGIRTIMVTGDNPYTAKAVGDHVGLVTSAIITGEELSRLTDDELEKRIDEIKIFARTTPEHKLRIVRILQKKGEIVTVTGDGINDALALKQANTGVAMGVTGTDVAKEVADMVITDDNFVSIVSAIHEGRVIFDNMVKSITYLISTNLGEVLLILFTIIASIFLPVPLPTPLLAVHILWINLVTDGLPALSLAFDKGTVHTMKPRPHLKDNELLERHNILFMVIRGLFISSVSFTIFITALQHVPLSDARILTFNILVLLQLATVFFIRKGQSLFSNKVLIVSIAVSIFLQFIVTAIPPFAAVFTTK